MARITEAESGNIRLVLHDRTVLQPRDEVVFASGGIYRLLPFDRTDQTIRFERVDGPDIDQRELSLAALEREFGNRVRMTAPSRSRSWGQS